MCDSPGEIVGSIGSSRLVAIGSVADHVIDNSGSMDDLDARADEIWADLTRRAAAG